MAKWETKTVRDIVDGIANKDYVLPVIQRRLVWDEEKMSLLFDSLLHGYSFGGIVAVKETMGRPALFASRPFATDGEMIPSAGGEDRLLRTRWFIVDGQQRLQTLYMGLRGTNNGRHLFLDLAGGAGFAFSINRNSLPKTWTSDEALAPLPCLWEKASDLFALASQLNDPQKMLAEIKQVTPSNFDEMAVLDTLTKFWKEFCIETAIGISVVDFATNEPEKSRQMVVELFRRLNDGGTRLTAFDLVASIFKGFDAEMEGFLEKTVNDYSKMGLTQDNLIKLLFILEDEPNKEMMEVTAKDVNFAITNRTRIENTLQATNDFMHKTGLDIYYEKYHPSFIPLFFLAYHIYHSEEDTKKLPGYFIRFDTASSDFITMRKWIIHSFLNDVFRSKGAGWIPYRTGIRKIHECMKGHKGKPFPMDEIFTVYKNHPLPNFSTEYSVDRLPHLNAGFLYFLIYSDGLGERTNDVDHIMPKSILESMNYSPEMINCICNYQLLDYSTNRGEKNATPLGIWLGKMPNLEFYLKTHLIPQDRALWDEQNFEAFYQARGEMLLERIGERLA